MNKKLFKNLKKSISQYERAISHIKNLYPFLKDIPDSEILGYLGLMSSRELIVFAKNLKHFEEEISSDTDNEVYCRCIDSEGMPKVLYSSFEQIRRAEKYLKKSLGLSLKIYQCPSGKGWHLSKV